MPSPRLGTMDLRNGRGSDTERNVPEPHPERGDRTPSGRGARGIRALPGTDARALLEIAPSREEA